MKKSQMALLVDTLKAANDEEYASVDSLSRQTVDASAAKDGWDPFEVWRTRIKPQRQLDPF